MRLGLESRVAMVAAGSKGLGLAIAKSLSEEGCAVSICARGREALDEAKKQLGPKAHAFVCDVADPKQLDAWHSEASKALGPIDVLVTNTGGPPAGRFAELKEEQWHEAIELTLMNVIRLCRLTIPSMQQRGFGRIVHLTSFVAKQPADLLTISSTLRAGLSGLTKTLASQVAAHGITVNAVLPGNILTDRQKHLTEARAKHEGISPEKALERAQAEIPMKRFGTPAEIGDVVAFLCSDRASYLTGVSLQIDGGLTRGTF